MVSTIFPICSFFSIIVCARTTSSRGTFPSLPLSITYRRMNQRRQLSRLN